MKEDRRMKVEKIMKREECRRKEERRMEGKWHHREISVEELSSRKNGRLGNDSLERDHVKCGWKINDSHLWERERTGGDVITNNWFMWREKKSKYNHYYYYYYYCERSFSLSFSRTRGHSRPRDSSNLRSQWRHLSSAFTVLCFFSAEGIETKKKKKSRKLDLEYSLKSLQTPDPHLTPPIPEGRKKIKIFKF